MNKKYKITKDKITNKSYPLIPGAMIGGEHYGFIIISDTNRGQNGDDYEWRGKLWNR